MRVGAAAAARLAAVVLVAGAGAARAMDDRSVLVVYAETRLLPVIATLDQAIRTTLQARSPSSIHFFTEYLDLSWFADSSGPEVLMTRLLKEKYKGANVDVVIACGDAALRFLLRERAEALPGVPLVFCAADRDVIREMSLPADVTGATMSLDWDAALDLVLRLHPKTRRIAFIGGTGPTAAEWERQARADFAKHAGRVEVEYLSGLPMADLLRRVAAMPEDTAGLFNSFIRDGAGRTFTGPEALSLVTRAAKFPVYSISETLIGHGIVGGPMIDWEVNGRSAADLAWRILSGARLGSVDIVHPASKTYVFDARQLDRWHIADRQLPAASIVRFRQPSFLEQYKWHAAAAIALTALQTLLIVGLLVERRQRKRAEGRLDERLRFETLLADLATRFIKIRVDDVDRQIEDGLRRVVEELGVDRATLGEFAAGGGQMRVTYSWSRSDVRTVPPTLESSGLPWTTTRLRRSEVVFWSRADELPEEASIDRTSVEELGIKSLAVVPFVMEGAVAGALACSVLRGEREWTEELVHRLRLLAEMFAIVLLRRRARSALEESENRFRVMADAAPVMVWVAGTDGGCIDFNRAWLEFTGRTLEEERGDGWLAGVHPDDRETCLRCYRGALAARDPFTIEYRLRRSDGAYRSMLDTGVPRFSAEGFSGYIGSAIDITDLKAAEAELESGREALAHALRVTTLGELTATLAHEISQPLTAIVSNAEAIRLTLASGKLDRDDLEEALQDIAGDAQRATEVIRRLRALFRKDHSERRPVDVNEAIAEVTGLLRKDLERKRVTLQLDLATDLPRVLGDAVQLEQVLLNVVVNACDAMKANDGVPRLLRIETARREPGKIGIAIRDSGKGIADGELAHIFDRFVTTKPDGLGMGLSISRSIVEAHGGRIWATRNEDRGLTIHSELPGLVS